MIYNSLVFSGIKIYGLRKINLWCVYNCYKNIQSEKINLTDTQLVNSPPVYGTLCSTKV